VSDFETGEASLWYPSDRSAALKRAGTQAAEGARMEKLLAVAILLGCGGAAPSVSDEDDLTTPGALAAGNVFRLEGAATAAGDLLYLQLGAGGRFAWTRCYDAACAAPVREDGTWQLARSASGRRSIRFYQRGPAGDPAAHFHSAYAYAVSRDGARLWLRADGGARPFIMKAAAEADLCAASGGSWSDATHACDCRAGWPIAWSPGAGGCWQSPPAGESACDATQGSWTDDDPGLIGTYCECGIGRHLTGGGCVANRF
jgi:hypothetical protein